MTRLIRYMLQGKTYLRYTMDEKLRGIKVMGRVLDVGGGKFNEYHEFMPGAAEAEIEVLDMSHSTTDGRPFDLERDMFPHADATFDTLICLNLLEHIYNYRHVVDENYRVMKPGAKLVGFVPFLLNYHPDPHDYFRYTNEALERILSEGGFIDIEIIPTGKGPAMVGFNTLALSLPSVVRVLLLPLPLLIDTVFLALRPETTKRVPLGYIFLAKKP